MRDTGKITRVTAVRGRYNDRWVVFAEWMGAERAVYENECPFAATRWARKNGWDG